MPQPKPSRSKSSAGRQGATRNRSPSAAGAKRAARPRPAEAAAEPERDEALRASLASVRDVLTRSVVVTTDRVQETLDDAVRGGHLTRAHAQRLADEILSAGRRQTDDLRSQIERLVGRGRTRASQSGERVRREVDRARRVVVRGGPAPLPIADYEGLTAVEVNKRLAGLSPDELRRVREHEQGNAARKSVLKAIDRRLG